MSRDDVAVTEDAANRVAEAIEALASRVALVAFHHRGPLVSGHGACTGICEQIDQNIGSREKEEIVVSMFEQRFAFGARGPANRLNALDAEGFDDGAGHRELLKQKPPACRHYFSGTIHHLARTHKLGAGEAVIPAGRALPLPDRSRRRCARAYPN